MIQILFSSSLLLFCGLIGKWHSPDQSDQYLLAVWVSRFRQEGLQRVFEDFVLSFLCDSYPLYKIKLSF